MASVSRRALLKGAAAGTLAMATGVDRAFAQPSGPPNIVFIMADDLGYADVACYGRPDLKTPNIDRIAANGVRFLQGYANSPVCSATRLALITGRYQYRLAAGLEEPINTRDTAHGLPPDHPTLPSLLKKAGYGTTLIGKWHLGRMPAYGPLKSGYDRFWGFQSGALDYYTHLSTAGQEDLWDGEVPFQQTGYLTEMIGARASDVVRDYARRGTPFFLSVHFNAPHWPWEAPGDTAEAERLRGSDLRHFDGGSQKTYVGMIEAMDAAIGRVLQALDASRVADNTIVVFTSDNGGERFADTWPFTGRKTELLEGGLRVPTIVSWPARIPKGKTSDQVAITMDWVPTLLAAAGASPHPSAPSDGMNLLPHLTQNAAPVARTLYWRYKANAQRAIRDGDFKFLKILDNTFLFNVVDDPLERANLKTRRTDVYDRLEAKWLEWNETMWPEIDESFTESHTGAQLADHIGAKPATKTADNPKKPGGLL
jgi:arylsulfatase A-like enzyme